MDLKELEGYIFKNEPHKVKVMRELNDSKFPEI